MDSLGSGKRRETQEQLGKRLQAVAAWASVSGCFLLSDMSRRSTLVTVFLIKMHDMKVYVLACKSIECSLSWVSIDGERKRAFRSVGQMKN